ncbi:Acetyltransferase (GNAT) family protein [Saccharopolyspora spinosa]|uniref:Acetyltransferase (GNAT) family protein n=1 Tax=Saccharopolyspora spinosa TaxID=60894 RepID=A0A2N3XTC1_SACSN|nr:Acetyltransferase (GNAT) family protein [Saccharopolyspora spinosa]
MYLRRAEVPDIDMIAAMWTRSSQWLAKHGFDQWQYPVKMHNITRTVKAGSVWIADVDGGRPAGMLTVDTDAEPRYWKLDNPADALYAHRMVTERWASGFELGSALLDWAGRRAAADGRSWLRLDAWRSNTSLHHYYLARGFELVRIVADDPADPSGACFQRGAKVQSELGPKVIEQ